MRVAIVLTVLVSGLAVLLAGCESEATPTPVSVKPAATSMPVSLTIAPPPRAGSVIDKWALWTDGPHLRGANIWQRVVVPDLDGPEFLGSGHVGPPYTQADLDRLAALGANYVNISGPGLFTERPPYEVDEKVQAHLDNLLDMIARADMFAVITARTGPGRSDFTFYRDGAGDWFDESLLVESVWEDQAAQDAWVEMWRYTAERYRDNPIVVGYDLMCEPNSAGILLDIWEPDEFYPDYAGTLYDWNQLYPRITAAVREVDVDTPILVAAMGWSAVRWLTYLEPTGDSRTVYMVHQYEPQTQYTHQEPPAKNTYPGEFDVDWDGVPDSFNRQWLDETLSSIDAFRHEHGVPVAVNEFGVVRWVPGGAAFMDDQMDLFERRRMNHALWVWDPAWEPWTEEVDAFNFRHGPDPDHHTDVASSDLMDVIVKYWGRNTARPSNSTAAAPPASTDAQASVVSPLVGMSLAIVQDFLYQLQNLDLEAIGQTSYDLVVMDYSADGSDESAFTADQIAALRHSPGGDKIVLAYMSIGEAENYRFYWNPGWDADGDGRPNAGAPAWLDVENADWGGNYKVRYWDAGWQTIIYGGPGSYLDKIIAAGFDGVYLDIIDAYNYYEEQGRDSAAREMANFVIALAAYARARQPGFLVFPQNAPELAADLADYLVAVDGIGQEDIYYGYEEDDQPTPPAVTAELEGYLDIWKNAGRLVLTVDYATMPGHVDDAYARSRAKGYVPFVTVRDLDRLIINPGHEPGASSLPSFTAHETRPDGALRLTDPPPGASDQNPTFSPDGQTLLFTRFHEGYNDGPAGLYLLSLGGSDAATGSGQTPVALLDEADHDSVNLPGSSWNAATGRITFSSDRQDTDEIWTIAADGSGLFRVTYHDYATAGYFIEPSFSPDGQWVVFEADPDVAGEEQQGSIWKVRADGTGLAQLTDGAGGGTDDRQPNWSPTGERILFQRRQVGSDDWNLYTMVPDGSDIRQVTTAPSSDTDASWSSDGRWIVYSSDHGGLPVPNIFVIPVHGGQPIRVTHDNACYDGAPSWSPDGGWISFESHPGDQDVPAALWLIAAPVTETDSDRSSSRTRLADVAH